MITKEAFGKIKKGDRVITDPERGRGFHRPTYIALEDFKSVGGIEASEREDWTEGDDCFHLFFHANNDWFINPTKEQLEQLDKQVQIEIKCPCCEEVFMVSKSSMKILDELTSLNVGFVIS